MVEVMIWAARCSMPPDNLDNRACVTAKRKNAREAT